MFGKANDLSPQYIDILTEHYDLIQLSYRLLPEVSLDCIIEGCLRIIRCDSITIF